MSTAAMRGLRAPRNVSLLYALLGVVYATGAGMVAIFPDGADLHGFLGNVAAGYLFILVTAPLMYRFLDRLACEHESQREQYRLILENSMDGILLTAPDGRVFEANDAACRILDRSLQELRATGRASLFDADDPELAALLEHREREGSVRGQIWALKPDGGRTRVEVSSAVFSDPAGDRRTAMVIRDITDQWWAGKRQGLAALALQHTAEAFAVLSPDWRVLYVNPAFEVITGRRFADVAGRRAPVYESLAGNEGLRRRIMDTIDRQGFWAGELPSRTAAGEPLTLRGRVVAAGAQAGEDMGFVAVFSDVSHLTDYARRLEALTDYCQLTGLPNRVRFERSLRERIAGCPENPLTVLMIDVDHFRAVNESLGLQLADQVLREIACRLHGAVAEGDMVARHTSDSFLMMLNGIISQEDRARAAQHVLALFETPIRVEERCIGVTVTIGVSHYPNDGEDPGTLLQAAETALAVAKEHARQGVRFYAKGQDQWARKLVEVSTDLRQALRNREIVPYFQPIVDSATGRLRAVEALARWQHPSRGLLGPYEFIDVAERSELISLLAEEVLRQTCEWLVELDRSGAPPITASVNISARQLGYPDLPGDLEKIVREAGVDPRRIVLEITESGMMAEPERMPNLIRALKATGMRVVIDDFGTGYSSLAYLRFLPVDGLKIDRAFCRDLPDDLSSAALVRSILNIAREFRLTVVAEGIETEAQAAFMAAEGCPRLQGYLYGAPMPAEDLLASPLVRG